ncbi:coiled-coil domain-containing protein 39 isoform X1 [Parasteatoda tepidariorum]|nr:coiled-coil domain-containing protein 39 isoform X1 [Parasteatoda tepidariorum]
MFENTVDLAGYDMLWRTKPELPIANEENKQLEESLKLKKIEVEKLKVILENNINKGKKMRDHINDLHQTLSYKQQLFKTREHELEMEIHSEKLIDRECSRLEQEMKAVNNEIKSLRGRQKKREMAISQQREKGEKLKSAIQWDEEKLMQYLEKSAEMEKDNMVLMKYTSEDDSKITELGLLVERLSKEAYEKKCALEDVNTEVLIVQSELDRIQEEFRSAYDERNNLINNWEKAVNQIQLRSKEINKLSENIENQQDEQVALKHTLKEQKDLLTIEISHNNEIERKIKEKDVIASKLRNDRKTAIEREEDLKAELSTVRNVLNNILLQKQTTQNSLQQLKKQLDSKSEKIITVRDTNKKLEDDIESLAKETFDADHYTKELDAILQREKSKNQKLENEIANICKTILSCNHEMNDLKIKEKFLDTEIKNKQTEVKNLNVKLIALDQIRTKQESEMYNVESHIEKLQLRLKKMAGETNEEERKRMESQRSSLLTTLEEKKKTLNTLTEELKIMAEKMTLSSKALDSNKKTNTELKEKIKYFEFYISNSQKSLKCCISRKQEILVQECLEKFQMKRFQKLLNGKNRSVASLQKNKLEFETMMNERVEELKRCNEIVDAEIRTEADECSILKRKYQESNDKAQKLQSKYKIILDALGISEPGEGAEAEMLIKAENDKRDLLQKRDYLMKLVLKAQDELSALKNTVWIVNAANEQFRQAIHPPGINSEDSEKLRHAEIELRELAIQIHTNKSGCQFLEESISSLKEKLTQEQDHCKELQIALRDQESENEKISKKISDLQTKIQRAERCNSRLSLDIKTKTALIGIEEDIRIHLLREIRRDVSDLLFSAVENIPDVQNKIKELYEEANLPLPSRARSLFSRSSSAFSLSSRRSSAGSPLSSAHSTRSDVYTPSIVTLGSLDDIES